MVVVVFVLSSLLFVTPIACGKFILVLVLCVVLSRLGRES